MRAVREQREEHLGTRPSQRRPNPLAFFILVAVVGVASCVIGDQEATPRLELTLPIPPVLQPTRSDATGDYYTVTQMGGLQQIVPGTAPTPIEGYNGVWPGPTIVARRGR